MTSYVKKGYTHDRGTSKLILVRKSFQSFSTLPGFPPAREWRYRGLLTSLSNQSQRTKR